MNGGSKTHCAALKLGREEDIRGRILVTMAMVGAVCQGLYLLQHQHVVHQCGVTKNGERTLVTGESVYQWPVVQLV